MNKSLHIKLTTNPLTPNDHYSGRTAPLTSKRCIIYIYSTNISTEYFKHAKYTLRFFPLQNADCFITLTHLVPILFTFYIQGVLKLKKNNSCSKRLKIEISILRKYENRLECLFTAQEFPRIRNRNGWIKRKQFS